MDKREHKIAQKIYSVVIDKAEKFEQEAEREEDDDGDPG